MGQEGIFTSSSSFSSVSGEDDLASVFLFIICVCIVHSSPLSMIHILRNIICTEKLDNERFHDLVVVLAMTAIVFYILLISLCVALEVQPKPKHFSKEA